MNKISVIIPTYNRKTYWQSGYLLDALYKQTDTDFQLVIIDDNSDDNTVDFLKESFNKYKPPFEVLLIENKKEHSSKYQASANANNLGFWAANGDIIIHIDDDCTVHPDLIKFVGSINIIQYPATWYGNMIFIDPNSKNIIDRDRRTKLCYAEKIIELKNEDRACWGAIWAAPTQAIRFLGGHDLNWTGFRSSDSRLGWRLFNILPAYFTIKPEMTIYHHGLSIVRAMQLENRYDEWLQIARSQTTNTNFNEPIICNGGYRFWISDYFKVGVYVNTF